MVKTIVQSRGQITLPKSVREAASVGPGDLVTFRVLGEHRFLVEVLPVKPLQYFWERFGADEPYDDDAIRDEWHEVAAAEALDA